MKITVRIKRQNSFEAEAFYQTILCDCDAGTNIATLLREINAEEILDIDGDPVGEIAWECSCLQKKCGACAMRINGTPALACDTKLSNCKRGKLSLEPLRKFPTVRDLIVDRSLMMDNLRSIHNWLEQTAHHSKKAAELSYDASRCLQCGCCLEVCPNFMPDGDFYGAAAFVPASRILAQLEKSNPQDLTALYQKNIYGGCGKSLSCHNICPAGIDVEQKLSNANAVAVWKRFFSS